MKITTTTTYNCLIVIFLISASSSAQQLDVVRHQLDVVPRLIDNVWHVSIQSNDPNSFIENILLCKNPTSTCHIQEHVAYKTDDHLHLITFTHPKQYENVTLTAHVKILIHDKITGEKQVDTCEIQLSPLGERVTTDNIIDDKEQIEEEKPTYNSPQDQEEERGVLSSPSWTLYVGGSFMCMVVLALVIMTLPDIRKRIHNTYAGYNFATGQHVSASIERRRRNQDIAREKLDIYGK